MSNWISYLKGNPIDWLMNSNEWTRYKTHIDLLGNDCTEQKSKSLKYDLYQSSLVVSLFSEIENWMSFAATRNNDANLSYFKLKLLSDIGLQNDYPRVENIYNLAKKNIIDSLFACKGIPPEKGQNKLDKDANNSWHVSPCNSPILISTFLELGYRTDIVLDSVNKLIEKWESNSGWFCHYFFVNGQYKKTLAGCPMAAIMALEVFSKVKDIVPQAVIQNAYQAILFHKNYGQTLYYFGRSKKFWTMKFPYIWYNALYMADVLSNYKEFVKDKVMEQCINWILEQQDDNGRFKPTSIFMPYKNWDFGNKKEASPWITFLCCRILKRHSFNLTTASTGPI